MPDFTFTSPEGKQYTVSGPPGATKEQAFGILQAKINPRTPRVTSGDLSDQIPGNQAVYAEPEKKPGFVEKQIGDIEANLAIGSGLTGGALGYAGGALGGIAGEIASGKMGTPEGGRMAEEAAQEGAAKLTYAPRTPEGQKRLESVSKAVDASKLQGLGPTEAIELSAADVPGVLRSLKSGATKAAETVSPAARRLVDGTKVSIEKPISGVPPETIAGAIKAGYKVPPSQAGGGVISKALEGFSGKIQTAQKASSLNAENTNRLVREAMGIAPDARITDDGLRAIRAEAGKTYAAIKELNEPIIPTKEYRQRVLELGGDFKAASKEFPELLKNDQIDTLIKSLSSPETMSGRGAIEVVKKLRADATANLRAYDRPERQALGFAQRKAADAVDDLIEEHLERSGNKALSDGYRKARETIAKAHDVEAALNDATGNVSALYLARLYDKGRPLTGELKQVAEFAKAFPKAAQDVEKIGSQPGLSPLDYATGGLASLAAGHVWPVAAVAARPAVRSGILSSPYQAMLGNRAEQRIADMVESTAARQGPPLQEVPGAGPLLPGTDFSTLLKSAQPENVPLPKLPERIQSDLEKQMGVPGSSLSLGSAETKTPLPKLPPQESGLLSIGGKSPTAKEVSSARSIEMKLRPEVINRVNELRKVYADESKPMAERIAATKELENLKGTYPGFVMDMEKADATFKKLYESGKEAKEKK